MVFTKEDLIYGQRFEDMADIVIDGNGNIVRSNTNHGSNCDEYRHSIPVVYAHTHNASGLFQWLNRRHGKYIVVTHNSDGKVKNQKECGPNDIAIEYIRENVVQWYAQNVCVSHPKLQSIPIGLENPHWFTEIDKMGRMCERCLFSNSDYTRNKIVYMNHNCATNPSERIDVWNRFKNNSFVTTKMRKNPDNYVDYLNDLATHFFVLCPEGNGTDTHRMWEALYMGCIPILRRNNNTKFYEGLVNALFVDNWVELDNMDLSQKAHQSSNLTLLHWKYWEDKIRKAE